jgi:AcrR family transcriptional regulator
MNAYARKTPHETGTRQRLLDAATDLICEHGVSGTRVDAIARRAGVMKTAIYWHFQSKEGLMAAVVHHVGDAITHELSSVDALVGDASCECGDLVEILKGLTTRRPMLLRVIQAMVSERGSMPPVVAEALVTLHHRSTTLLARAFAAYTGNEAKDEEPLALSAISLTIGTIWMHRLDPNEVPQEKMIHHVQSIISMCLNRRVLA